uniref:Putative secreted peptide n=1 Tax=Anopheles braziliensis TaxID=58242 RepID=A0A2M3ZVD5_9DIPT
MLKIPEVYLPTAQLVLFFAVPVATAELSLATHNLLFDSPAQRNLGKQRSGRCRVGILRTHASPRRILTLFSL